MKAKNELPRLQSLSLPHATPEIFGAKVPDGASDTERIEGERLLAIITGYLKEFVPPSNCICCGKALGAKSAIEGLLSGATFQWSLQHGEGFCSNCKYPARAMHYIKDGEKEIVTVRNFILQYHPVTLTVPDQEVEA